MPVKHIAVYNAIYPYLSSTVYELCMRYWSEIATFSYHLAFNALVEGVPLGQSSLFLVVELPDGQATIWCKNIPEKLNPPSRVHARHRRQTDGFMPFAKRNVVTFG